MHPAPVDDAADLPTQVGYDFDEAVAQGEVGQVGVAIDSLDIKDLPAEVGASITSRAAICEIKD